MDRQFLIYLILHNNVKIWSKNWEKVFRYNFVMLNLIWFRALPLLIQKKNIDWMIQYNDCVRKDMESLYIIVQWCLLKYSMILQQERFGNIAGFQFSETTAIPFICTVTKHGNLNSAISTVNLCRRYWSLSNSHIYKSSCWATDEATVYTSCSFKYLLASSNKATNSFQL